MAKFDRKSLKEVLKNADIEMPKDVLEQIFDLHTSSVEDFKTKIDDLTTDLENAKQESEAQKGDTVSKEKYNKLDEEFKAYKKDVEAKQTKSTKEHAYRELLKGAGVSEKRLDAILKVSDLDSLELDENGKIKEAEKHTQTVKTEWADFIESTSTKGATTSNPPANNGGATMTKDEIFKMENGRFVHSANERQEALAKLSEQKG